MNRNDARPTFAEEFSEVYGLRVRRLAALSRVGRDFKPSRPPRENREWGPAFDRLFNLSLQPGTVPLIGPAGSGKSAMVASLVMTRIGSLAVASVVTGVELVQMVADAKRRDVHARRWLRRLGWANLLVIDDADRIQPADWHRYRIGELLEVRWAAEVTTVLVGRTLTPDMWAAI